MTSHLDPELRQQAALAYEHVRENRTNNRATDALAYRLQLLARPVPLDPASRNHLIEEIEEARGDFDDMKLRSKQTMGRIIDAGLAPPQSQVNSYLAASHTIQFCREHRVPMGRVEAQPEH